MIQNTLMRFARIRALETSLLNSAVIEQLMACQTDVQCLQLLQEKGWGDADTPENDRGDIKQGDRKKSGRQSVI